jgi:hypothetical protein
MPPVLPPRKTPPHMCDGSHNRQYRTCCTATVLPSCVSRRGQYSIHLRQCRFTMWSRCRLLAIWHT